MGKCFRYWLQNGHADRLAHNPSLSFLSHQFLPHLFLSLPLSHSAATSLPSLPCRSHLFSPYSFPAGRCCLARGGIAAHGGGAGATCGRSGGAAHGRSYVVAAASGSGTGYVGSARGPRVARRRPAAAGLRTAGVGSSAAGGCSTTAATCDSR